MITEQPAFPLSWPLTWPRTKNRTHSQFGRWGAHPSVAKAKDALLPELRRLGASRIVVSTNVALRRDGLPYSNQKEPADPGVAVYFTLKNAPRVLACDRWSSVGENLYAIAKHIEALRGQDRWGVGSVEQAFAGYAALPPPSSEADNCWTTLELPFGASADQINDRYRLLAQVRHPDRGGTQDAMAKLNKAREETLAVVKGRP